MMRNNTLLRLALIAILLGAFALRLYRLDHQELRGDEAFGYFFSQRAYGEIIAATIALAEPHPVASYFVQKAWLGLAGGAESASEFILRFPGAWWGLLSVALLYRLGRRVALSPWPALLAAALLAISPYAIWHAQDARMYSMSLALTTASVLFGLEALARRRWPWAAAYIVAAALALHTHYFAAFVLLALNLFVLTLAALGQRLRPMLLQWLLWQVIVAALYLPWLLRASAILSGYDGNGDSPGLFEALRRALAVFAAGESASPALGGWWTAVAALLLLIGVLRLALGSAEQRRTLLLLALYLCLPLLATWWSAQARPIFNERYLVAALPPFYLLLAAACEPLHSLRALPRTARRAVPAFAAGLAALLLVGMGLSLANAFHDPAYSKTRGWRDLAEAIEELSAGLPPERVRVAQNFPDPTLWYYYRGPVEHLVLPPQANDAEGARAVVQALAQTGIQRIILPIQPSANWDAEGLASMALDGWYDRAAQTQEGVWPLQVYAQPLSALTPVNASFGDGFTLRGFASAPDMLPPGGLLTVHLDWAADAASTTSSGTEENAEAAISAVGEHKVFVQLLDSEGQLVAQDDRPLVLTGPRAAGSGLAVYGLRLPPTLDNGPYRLIAGIYDPAQPGAPRLQTADAADHVVLREY
jgi:4-amino-4-deoxy-L-arabinose transferase-like glycosyltransferase